MAEDKNYRRSRRSAVIYTPIAALLILFLVIFGVSVFFRVSDIEVIGAKKYTTEQVMSASGMEIGDNLVFIDPYASADKIMKNLPYLSEVRIEKIIPNKVTINVTESQPMAVIPFQDEWWLIDQKARVLEVASTEMADKKINIDGFSPTAIRVGQQIVVDDSEQTKLLYLKNVLAAIETDGISDDVKTVDMTNVGTISFTYMDRFKVILGNGEEAEFKLALMHDVIIQSQLQPDDKGRVDVSDVGKPRFIPDEA